MATSRLIFRLVHDEAKKNAKAAIDAAGADGSVKVCVIQDETRTLEQNALLWPCLRLFAKNVKLCVDGEMIFMDEETWKDVLTGAFKGEQAKMVKYQGHLVLVGRSTSQMGRREFAGLLTYILSEMVEHDLTLPPRAAQDIHEYIREYGDARP